MMMMISVKLASIAVILLGLLPTLSVAAIRGAGNQQEQQQKTTTTTTTTLHDHRKLVVGDGSTPALCTTDGSVVVAAIATGANVVVYLCDGFFFQPTLSMGLINDSQKVRIVCMGTCKIDGGLKPNALPREVFEVRTGGVLQMYGVDIENFASSRVVDAGGVGCVVSYASCKLQNNSLLTVTGQLGGTTEIENGATGLAFGSTFFANKAFSGGGAIRVQGEGSTLVLKSSIFDGNTASRSGGALHIQNAPGVNPILVYIYNSVFQNNGGASTRSGGAIWSNQNAIIKIVETSFTGNLAGSAIPTAAQGGALFIGLDSLLDSDTNTFNSNDALGDGDHIFITNAVNYIGCASDTFFSPNTNAPTSVMTSVPVGTFTCGS